MLDTEMDDVSAKAVRSALLNWGFTARRGSDEQPPKVTDRLLLKTYAKCIDGHERDDLRRISDMLR
ncbi:MAG: hypothetical protein ACRCYU_17715 [Nocardioides sp.]